MVWLHIHKWESYKRGGDFPIWVVSLTLVVISLVIVFESLNCHAELKSCRIKCHAELDSASHREPTLVFHREPLLVLVRSQILKFAVKREQRQACLNYAER